MVLVSYIFLENKLSYFFMLAKFCLQTNPGFGFVATNFCRAFYSHVSFFVGLRQKTTYVIGVNMLYGSSNYIILLVRILGCVMEN